MLAEHQTLGSPEIFQVVDSLDLALGVLRRQQGRKTALDVYFVSVLSTLRRALLTREDAVSPEGRFAAGGDPLNVVTGAAPNPTER
jgi:hypothetical protein